MERQSKPTIRDVAAAAGVSRGTVSRVINGGHWVSEEARAAVDAAIARTGYTANPHARSLATGRSQSLAFLLTEEHHLLFDDPIYGLLLRAAAEALSRRSMTLVLLVAGTRAEKANVLEYLRAGHVDGVLLISSHASDPFLVQLHESGVPMVATGVPLALEGLTPSVAIDESGAARTMTRYLLGRGYRRIAHIAGPDDTPGGRFRLAGFRDEMGEHLDEALIEAGDYSRASGTRAMERLLERTRDLDAVFAASDSMAAGAVTALRRAGLRVPEDVAVAGFDDSGVAEAHDPPLTTMRQPWRAISEGMVEMVLSAVAGDEVIDRTLEATLVERESA